MDTSGSVQASNGIALPFFTAHRLFRIDSLEMYGGTQTEIRTLAVSHCGRLDVMNCMGREGCKLQVISAFPKLCKRGTLKRAPPPPTCKFMAHGGNRECQYPSDEMCCIRLK